MEKPTKKEENLLIVFIAVAMLWRGIEYYLATGNLELCGGPVITKCSEIELVDLGKVITICILIGAAVFYLVRKLKRNK